MLAGAAEIFYPDQQPTASWIAPIALNTSNLEDGNTHAYRPWFENLFWQGDLVEYNIDTTGNISTTVNLKVVSPSTLPGGNWSARLRFAAQETAAPTTYWDTGRRIVTMSSSGVGIPFRQDTLSTPQLKTINSSITTAKAVVNYIRGDRSNETTMGFRIRKNLLGDIIHSDPVYVGTPIASYTFDNYGDFQYSNRNREALVYVGANDGLLHAFKAGTGDEVFAYAPSMLFSKLYNLTGIYGYFHRYYVDGELTSGDVQMGGAWETVLVGGIGAGGKGLFALKVTDPTATDETSVARKLLWEIPASSDSDLGYIYGRPSLTKLSDGKWYAVTGNGYNSANGKAMLYLIDIATGKSTKITADSGSSTHPNGLSAPILIDADGDFVSDYAYAGDINGNLWKFDLRGGPSAVSKTRLIQATDNSGSAQAITTIPEVARHPNGGFMVYFGTGRLFTGPDALNTQQQSIYGIWDKGTGSLFTQTQAGYQHTYDVNNIVRTTSRDDSPLWSGASANGGWRVDLPAGERLLTAPRLRAKRLEMVTTNPTVTGGENWLVEVNYMSGGAPDRVVFDLNGDGALDTQDHVDGNPDLLHRPVAWRLSSGVMSQPVIARLKFGIDATYINGLTLLASCYNTSCDNIPDSDLMGRLQQLYDQLVLENIKLMQLQTVYGASTGDIYIQQKQIEAVVAELTAQRDITEAAGYTADIVTGSGKHVTDITDMTSNAIVDAQPEVRKEARVQLQDKLQKAPATSGPSFGIGPHSWVELYSQ